MVTTFSRSPFVANELAELVNNKASTSDTGVGNLSLYEQWKETYKDDPHKYKAEQTVIQADANQHRSLLQETMDKNKVESDQQFAEIMRVLKILQPTTTAVTSTTTPSPYQGATTIPPPYPTQSLPVYTSTMPPPYTLTQPLIFQQYPPPSLAAYTSFFGLCFDSQGYPIPTRPTGDFSRPFSTGEHNFSLGSTGGIFTGPIRTTPLPNHGSDPGWGSRTDYRLRKLKMPLFNGDDVYDWVYQAERFFDIQGLFTTGERLRAAMMCLEGPTLSWSRWSATKEPFRTWEELKSRMLIRFQSFQAGSLHEQFFSISQNGMTRDYVTTFEKMEAQLAQLPGLQEDVQEEIFIKGPKTDLRVVVRTQNLVGVRQAIELALLIDEAGKEVAAKPPNKVGGDVGDSSRPPAVGYIRVGCRAGSDNTKHYTSNYRTLPSFHFPRQDNIVKGSSWPSKTQSQLMTRV
ncbi:ankyrin repeat-containing protein [Tanacetum coccineum]